MKRDTFVLVFILLSFVSVNSQKLDDEDPLYARAGFKGGVNYSNILGDIDGTGARVRVHLGAVVEYPISSRFFIQGELFYSALGYKIDIGNEEQKISLNYISLPIVAKTHITKAISLDTGPQFSLLANVGNEDVPLNVTNRNSVAQVSVGYLFKTKNNRRIIQEQ